MSLESIQSYCHKENFAGNTHIQCVPIQWILNYPEFSKDGHNFSEAIDLIPGKEWLVFPCVPETLDFKDKERSGSHGVVDTPTILGFVPGDTPMISSVLNTAKANEWVVILYYATGEAKVIGSPDYPARFLSSFNNRGNLNSGKGFDIEFYSEGNFKSFFLEEIPTPPASTCLPAIIYNDPTSPTYTAPAVSGAPFYLPKENIYINGGFLLTKNSVEDVDIEVIDSVGNPVIVDLPAGRIRIPNLPGGTCPPGTVEIYDSLGNLIGSKDVASGGTESFMVNDLPCVPTPAEGIAYQEPNGYNIYSTSYADYDAAWRAQNNALINVRPTNPLYEQQLDFNSADPFNTLLHNNFHGNKHRFTDSAGNPTPFALATEYQDHLIGRYLYCLTHTYFRSWVDFMSFAHGDNPSFPTPKNYFAPTMDEFWSLKTTKQSAILINGGNVPIDSNYRNWTCNVDESNTTQSIRMNSRAYPIESASVNSRGGFMLRLFHPISNP